MDQIDLVRLIFRKYGSIQCGLVPWRKVHNPGMRYRIQISMMGLSPSRVAEYLSTIYAHIYTTPNEVQVGITKKYDGPGTRSYIQLAWTSEARCVSVLDSLGWVIGKETWDKKVVALKRWIRYKSSSVSQTSTHALTSQ